MPDIIELYRENILSYSKKRTFFRPISSRTHHCDGRNPLCGDEISVSVQVTDGTLSGIALDGESCAIARASAAIMAETVDGLSAAKARELCQRVLDLLDKDKQPQPATDEAEAPLWASLTVIRDHPARLKCARLAWTTLLAALDNKETTTTE